MDISIIIVSYNTRDMTLACIRSVYEETRDVSFEILVVDNNSSDGSPEAIAEAFPDLTLFALKKNLGFAKANNYASKHAQGRYLLLLNPDTLVLNRGLDKLVKFAQENPDNLLYGGRTFYGDHSLNPTSCWAKATLWSTFCYATGLTSLFRHNHFFDPESYGNWQRDTVREVDIVTGCLLMIKTSLWVELEGFDEEFFMYAEDADLCLRASERGATPVIVPEATVVHYCGASEKVRVDKMIRLFRAKKQLMAKHWRPCSFFVGRNLLTSSALFRYVATTLLALFMPVRYKESKQSWQAIWQRRSEW